MAHRDLHLHRGGQAVVEVGEEVTSLERVVMVGLEAEALAAAEEVRARLVTAVMVALAGTGMWLL